MAEAYTAYKGRLLRLSDEPFQDFIADVSVARQLHESEGFSPDGLGNIASDLRNISDELVGRMNADTEENTASTIWKNLVELALESEDEGDEFLDAYTFVRQNRFLATEFGPSETATVDVIRGIASAVTDKKRRSGNRTELFGHFFDTYPADILETLYPPVGASVEYGLAKHPIIRHMSLFADGYLDVRDPAAARVLRTLEHRRFDTEAILPEIIEKLILIAGGERLPLPKMSFTRVIDVKKTDWAIKADKKPNTLAEKLQIEEENPFDDEIEDEPTESDFADAETETTTDEIEEVVETEIEFDPSKGRCHVDRDKYDDQEEYQKALKRVIAIMFPERGESTEPAKSYCNNCQHREKCLDFAVDNKIKHGIWGGKSERERRRIRKERRAEETAA